MSGIKGPAYPQLAVAYKSWPNTQQLSAKRVVLQHIQQHAIIPHGGSRRWPRGVHRSLRECAAHACFAHPSARGHHRPPGLRAFHDQPVPESPLSGTTGRPVVPDDCGAMRSPCMITLPPCATNTLPKSRTVVPCPK
jgi:hypothetical protein